MNDFYMWAGLLVLVAVLLAVLPWLRKGKSESSNSLTNTGLIRQRLTELADEQQQGLLTESDKLQAEKELKLALLDEVKEKDNVQSGGKLVLLLGLLVGLSVGGASYYKANQLGKVEHWQNVKGKTSEIGQRILQGDKDLTLEDMQDFALGLRTRLLDKPDDPVGWMLLGRVSGALNRIDNSIKAFELSLKYDPDNIGTLISYAQALLMTGQEQQMVHAKRVLSHVLSLESDNTNAMGMLAVVAAELGDKQLALQNWQKLRGFVPQTDPNYAAINQRITQLTTELEGGPQMASQLDQGNNESSGKSVEVTVNISDELKAKLPKNGFLLVFAQESSGQNKMPAAVVKMPLTEFPVTVTLSNQNAMMPAYTLSHLESAKLVARVSVDGNVSQSDGNFQGEIIATLSTTELNQQTILIDRIL